MIRTGKGLLIALLLALLLGLPFAGRTLSAPGALQRDPRIARFGIGFTQEHHYEITDYNLRLLLAGSTFPFGWYSNWGTDAHPPQPYNMEYIQLIPVQPSFGESDLQRLDAVIRHRPSSLWIVGNEPERRLIPGRTDQSNCTPAEYARIYRDVYAYIKSLDSQARIAIGGVVQPSPLRLRWLEMTLAEYQALTGQKMPVDVWTIHVQILREQAGSWGAEIPQGIDDVTEGLLLETWDNINMEIFQNFIRDFRRWMKDQGEQDKKLIISEYGVLMPWQLLGETEEEGDQALIQFMLGTFDFLLQARDEETGYPQDDYHLVQRWLWYSLNEQPYNPATGGGFNGALFRYNDPGQLTVFGKAFRDYARSLYCPEQGCPVCAPLILKGSR